MIFLTVTLKTETCSLEKITYDSFLVKSINLSIDKWVKVSRNEPRKICGRRTYIPCFRYDVGKTIFEFNLT